MPGSILVAGGYGVVGANVAQLLRTSGFDGRLGIAGRNLERGASLAARLNAEAHRLDSSDRASVRAALADYDLVLAVLKDPEGELLEAALDQGCSFVGITQSPDSVSAMVFRIRNRNPEAAVLTLGHWQAGMAFHACRVLLKRFSRVTDIRIAALFDKADPIGPMVTEDSGDYMARALIREQRRWRWIEAKRMVRTVAREAGEPFPAVPMGVLDTISLAGLTDADNVRFDIGFGTSSGTLGGGPASHEIHYEIQGTALDGRPEEVRATLSAPAGQAHLTAIGIVSAVRALDDAGRAGLARHGWQLPETMIDPGRAVALAAESGVVLREGPAETQSAAA